MPRSRTQADDLLCTTAGLRVQVAGTNIEFQFPPKVRDNSRDGTWKEERTGVPFEPIFVYEQGNPRKISLEFKYIFDNIDWTVSRIQKQLNLLRKYFVNPSVNIPTAAALVVQVRIWGLGGNTQASYRLQSVGIKHGDTMIGTDQSAFPLLTDVTLQLRSWPQIANRQVVVGTTVNVDGWY